MPSFARVKLIGWQAWLAVTVVLASSLHDSTVYAQSVAMNDEPPASRAAGPQLDATSALLLRSSEQLRTHKTITARVRQQIRMFGQNLVGVGTYEQANVAPDYLFRLQFGISVGEGQATILQVCDGRFLWTNRAAPDGKRSVQRVDLNAARHTAAQASRDSSQAAAALTSILGGLPQTLESLAMCYQFDQPHTAKLHGVPVWIVSGKLTEVAARRFGADEDGNVPEHVPELVTVALGQEDLFPFRIEFRQADSGDNKNDVADPLGSPVLVTEWFEVQYDSPIDPQRFVFRPGEHQVEDVTAAYLAGLRDRSVPHTVQP